MYDIGLLLDPSFVFFFLKFVNKKKLVLNNTFPKFLILLVTADVDSSLSVPHTRTHTGNAKLRTTVHPFQENEPSLKY